MKNILVVFTGGTIGSTATEGIINTTNTAQFKLIQQFQQHYENHQQITFRIIQPIQILSENLAPAAWNAIIAAIETAKPDQYDGIIITHGTDTLSFTAAALSFYFHAIKTPILLVSSDYPLADPEANGLENFICAVEFILQKGQAGVFVPYQNQGQLTQLHKGARLASSLQLSGDFFSVQGKSYMQFENQRFTLFNSPAAQPQTQLPQLKARFSDRILMIRPYPGLNYDHFNLERTEAVLHDLYHSGTACASVQWGENYSLREFIKCCKEAGIRVYLAPAIESNNTYYSTRTLIEEGASMIWNMSIEAAYVKLLLAYGNFSDEQEIMNFINQDIAGEHVGQQLARFDI
ncbi:L-asparaginase [Candidatus Methylobacter favarea]|uniref:L-asparaginase n=1 Tax=Candidatus Methylobacter favarea TaxID=2707345 RepID=A0A8S0XUR9_9GAMM|nr:asparaginase [Candidatus Methylobacter favarea]CAA9892408.1 L-asparaginase [Candidatus Methylobacter favarea]